jgi:2-polyprenyl-3-methyl-5-hydroxy-6-metoxy-1,4-benzoquinol methylase
VNQILESSPESDTKVERVRAVFEDPDWYFSRRAFDIRIRAETVQELVRLRDDARILDIGCGDGSISLPLLTKNSRITLLDLSNSMLSIAKSKVPAELAGNIETVHQDFMEAKFAPQSFDLILCIGLLAHVVSPDECIKKMVSLLKPDGSLIVECSDASHFVTRFLSHVYKVKSLFKVTGLFKAKPQTYHLNAVTYSEIVEKLESHQLHAKSTYRYSVPPVGVHRIFSQATLYRINRGLFGRLKTNRNAWLGNEYLSLFSRNSSET